LLDQFGIIRRRKWLVLLVVIAVPLAAIAYSLHQKTLYKASVNVVVNRQDLASSVTGTSALVPSDDPERFIDTQATIARSSELAQDVITATRLGQTPLEFLKHSSVSTSQTADVMTFNFTAPTASEASRVATAYAQQFTAFRHRLDTEALGSASRDVAAQIARLRAQRLDDTPFYTSLLEKEQELRTLAALTTSNAKVVHSAGRASQVQPRPVRNGVLALAIGVLLGIAFAFLREALDSRVRSADELGRRLGQPLLARLPEPPRRLRGSRSLVALAEPNSPQAEAFRMLRTNLDFATLDGEVRSIMITSAEEKEGKSTTAANLAVMLARRGRCVVLVDLDLRRPFLHKFFNLELRPGITDVALARVPIEDAINRIPVIPSDEIADRAGLTSRNGHVAGDGFLEVITAGTDPADPGDFAGSVVLATVLHSLRERADMVIVDSPPLLPVGDAMTLSPNVDGILLLTRINRLRRRSVNELRRLLDSSPARKLGFAVTDADHEEGYGSYYASGRYRGDRASIEREQVL
jgi:Mrp family chromosome partitioning ATPase/capsular polysaccharide biosynthesis protein